jgi:hypothetical protein
MKYYLYTPEDGSNIRLYTALCLTSIGQHSVINRETLYVGIQFANYCWLHVSFTHPFNRVLFCTFLRLIPTVHYTNNFNLMNML